MREAILELARHFHAVELYGADDEGEGEAEGETPQEGAESDDGGEGDPKVEAKTYDEEYVAKLRKENAERRVGGKETTAALEKAEAELKELKQAEMTEIEKLKSDLEESQKTGQEAEIARIAALADAASFKIHTSVTLAAIEAGFQDPEDALGMISQDELVNDEGEIVTKTIKARLKSLADKKPYLLKQPTKGGGDGGPIKRPEDQDSNEAQVKAYHDQFINQGRVSRLPG